MEKYPILERCMAVTETLRRQTGERNMKETAKHGAVSPSQELDTCTEMTPP